jgi:hypothetical protein
MSDGKSKRASVCGSTNANTTGTDGHSIVAQLHEDVERRRAVHGDDADRPVAIFLAQKARSSC